MPAPGMSAALWDSTDRPQLELYPSIMQPLLLPCPTHPPAVTSISMPPPTRHPLLIHMLKPSLSPPDCLNPGLTEKHCLIPLHCHLSLFPASLPRTAGSPPTTEALHMLSLPSATAQGSHFTAPSTSDLNWHHTHPGSCPQSHL